MIQTANRTTMFWSTPPLIFVQQLRAATWATFLHSTLLNPPRNAQTLCWVAHWKKAIILTPIIHWKFNMFHQYFRARNGNLILLSLARFLDQKPWTFYIPIEFMLNIHKFCLIVVWFLLYESWNRLNKLTNIITHFVKKDHFFKIVF